MSAARYDIDGLKKRLGSIRTEDNPALVRQKSRDFFWYSPLLKTQLEHVTGDIVVFPTTEAEVIETLSAAYALRIPVTPRGTGTGNYGQAMPLAGGMVLDLSSFNQITTIAQGRVIAGPGALIADIDKRARAETGQELRVHPSTHSTATIGGFIAGGSGGVGSVKWGGLRDAGNIIRLKLVTLEETPRVLELKGDDLQKASHAYGTTGIITEVEMPLAPAYAWTDVIVGFDDLDQAVAYANDLSEQDGLLLKEVGIVAAPAAHDYFLRHQRFLPRNKHVVIIMVADIARDGFLAVTARNKDAEILFRNDTLEAAALKGLPPAFELTWNHTTLRALRVDPAITYLQVLYPFPNQRELVRNIHSLFGDEVIAHLEFVRFDGKVTCFGLPLVRYTSEERLNEIIAIHEEMGAPIFDPHRYTLEEGGMKKTDAVQLAFKRETDPKGLLNPGKMLAFDNPDYDADAERTWLFGGAKSGSTA